MNASGQEVDNFTKNFLLCVFVGFCILCILSAHVQTMNDVFEVNAIRTASEKNEMKQQQQH